MTLVRQDLADTPSIHVRTTGHNSRSRRLFLTLADAALLMALMVSASLGGCSTSSSPYAPSAQSERHPAEAERLNAKAAELMNSDPVEAEKVLRDALTQDLYCGPAHNNLGVLYLGRGDLYSAASEFQWARQLLPGHPDPRLNLALTLERAGKVDEALATYKTALEVYPNHLQSTQALARLLVRSGKAGQDQGDSHLKDLLEEIALRGETQQWKDWARLQLAKAQR